MLNAILPVPNGASVPAMLFWVTPFVKSKPPVKVFATVPAKINKPGPWLSAVEGCMAFRRPLPAVAPLPTTAETTVTPVPPM